MYDEKTISPMYSGWHAVGQILTFFASSQTPRTLITLYSNRYVVPIGSANACQKNSVLSWCYSHSGSGSFKMAKSL